MQRAAAIASSALRRLAAEAICRPPVLSRATSLAAASLRQPLAASSVDLHRPLTILLPPALQPCRGYARQKEIVPSDEEEDSDYEEEVTEDDLEGEGLDGLEDVDGDFDEFESGDEEMPNNSA